ncbi:MAG TPA: hypothetical protein VNT26_22795, partial [Candidatus Sulfotelmatobacter sp.]|nr:hypothetical protein [Candidatus Sulfotelmatobacter sp.]
TLIPLVWLLAATMTAGVQKIWHEDPRIGFLAQCRVLNQQWSALDQSLAAGKAAGDIKAIVVAEKALHINRVLHFNNLLDAVVAGAFLVLVTGIVLLSLREWILLLARRKLAQLRESEPVWLPDYAVAEAKPLHVAGLIALGFALAKELSGEAQLERAQQTAAVACPCGHTEAGQGGAAAQGHHPKTEGQLYAEVTERRFNGVTRCC